MVSSQSSEESGEEAPGAALPMVGAGPLAGAPGAGTVPPRSPLLLQLSMEEAGVQVAGNPNSRSPLCLLGPKRREGCAGPRCRPHVRAWRGRAGRSVGPCTLHWPQASESSLSTASWLGRSLLFLFCWTQTFGHIYSVASSLAGEAEGSVCRR